MCGGGGGYSLGINPKPPESLLDKKDTWGWSFCHTTFQKKCVPAKKEDIGEEKLFFQVSNEVREFPLTLLPIVHIPSWGGRGEVQNNSLPRSCYGLAFNNSP